MNCKESLYQPTEAVVYPYFSQRMKLSQRRAPCYLYKKIQHSKKMRKGKINSGKCEGKYLCSNRQKKLSTTHNSTICIPEEKRETQGEERQVDDVNFHFTDLQDPHLGEKLLTLVRSGDPLEGMFVDAALGECAEVLPEDRGDLVEEVDERMEDLIPTGFRSARQKDVIGARIQVETWK